MSAARAGVEDEDAVAAGFLGGVEAVVGAAEEGGGLVAVGGVLGDAAREGVAGDVVVAGALGEAGADLVEDGGGLDGGGAAHDDDELLAAVAADQVGAAEAVAERAGDVAEDGVADQVAVVVVDLLEVVDVEERDGDRLAGRGGGDQRGAQLLERVAAVEDAGEPVADREVAHVGFAGAQRGLGAAG